MAKDRFHFIVKAALVQDGWDITHDPLELKVGGVKLDFTQTVITENNIKLLIYSPTQNSELIWIPEITLK